MNYSNVLLPLLVVSTLSFAKPVTQPSIPPPPEVTEEIKSPPARVFNVDENPGSGTLHFSQGEKKTQIALGSKSGLYALGMIFDGSALPDTVGKNYRKRQIIQIALGTSTRKLSGQVPQFISLSIISANIPKKNTTYKLVVPGANDNPLQQMAMMMFMPPDTPAQQSDEDRLKNTYFAETGTLKLVPQALPRTVDLEAQSHKLQFYVQMMKLEIDSTLVTPFNSQVNDITGEISVPVYWPKGKEAQQLMNALAQQSLATGGPVPASVPPTPTTPAKK